MQEAFIRAWSHRGQLDPDRVALVAALRRLPEEQRRPIVLPRSADLPVAEVAAETGVPVGTVKADLFRGRAALAELVDEHDELAEGAGHA